MSQGDFTGIQTRLDKAGVTRYRGRVKDRGKWVPGPWRTSLADARGDRLRMQARKLDGPLREGGGQTIQEAAERFLAGADHGSILSRKNTRYAPKTVRGYRQAFDDWVNPELGHVGVERLRRSQVQRWVDWVGSQRAGATTRNAFHALAALYSWLLPRHDEMVDPTTGVRLPRPGGPRERYAQPEAISGLLERLDADLRLPYALAFYAGLRRGEIQGLTWENVRDGWIRVERSLDPEDGWGPPKSGHPRDVPVFAPLEPYLAQNGTGSVVPSNRGRWKVLTLGHAFNDRCRDCWGDDHVGLHEARHSFVTALVRAPDLDLKSIQDWVGHRDPATTLRIYAKARGRDGGPLVDPWDTRKGQALS
jgi:integrase